MSAALKAPKQKKCKVCCSSYTPIDGRLQRVCFDPTCAVEYVRRQKAKSLKREKREGRERLKTLTNLCAEAQPDVNRYVRIRDHGKGCISCDSPTIDDAGHFFPIGSKWRVNRIRFDTRLIHGQCRQCNSYTGGGNIHGYIAGIRKRYGEEYLALMYEIKRMAEHGELPPLTKDEVREIAANHRRMARELGKAINTAACV